MKDWLTAKQAAEYAQCSVRAIYLGVQRKKLRAARLNGNRQLRFLHAWLDEWLQASVTIEILTPDNHMNVVD